MSSIQTPTPSRLEAPPRCLTRMLDLLSEEGWRVEIVAAGRNERLGFSLVARSREEPKPSRTTVIHGYLSVPEVLLQDVWRLVAHLNDVQGDAALLCIGPGTQLSRLAQQIADRLHVEVRRLAD